MTMLCGMGRVPVHIKHPSPSDSFGERPELSVPDTWSMLIAGFSYEPLIQVMRSAFIISSSLFVSLGSAVAVVKLFRGRGTA